MIRAFLAIGVIEGIPDRSHVKAGAKVEAVCLVPKNGRAALAFDVEELHVEP